MGVLSLLSQPVLHWRFNNIQVISGDSLQFDVELKCTQPGTWHTTTTLWFTYNLAAFGSSVQVSYTKLGLLDGFFFGVPKYNIIPLEYKPGRIGLLAESIVLDPTVLNEVGTDWLGYLRFGFKPFVNNPSALEFVARIGNTFYMDGGQYYIIAPGLECKYGIPPDYAGIYENSLEIQGIASPGWLRGYVKDAVTLTGIGDAWVSSFTSCGTISTFTWPEGYYSLPLPEGVWDVTAAATGYQSLTVPGLVISFDSVTWQNFILGEAYGGSVTGTIVSCIDSVPIPGAAVCLQPGNYCDTTDSSGTFAIPEIPEGTYDLYAEADGYHPLIPVTGITVFSGQTTFIENLCLQPLESPVNLTSQVWCDSVTLVWSPPGVTTLSGFNVYKDGNLMAFTQDTGYIETHLFNGDYHFCITAVYPEGESQPVCIDVHTDWCLPPQNIIYSRIDYCIYLWWSTHSKTLSWCDISSAGSNAIGLQQGGTFACASRWNPDNLYDYIGWYFGWVNFFWFTGAPEATFVVKVWSGAEGNQELVSLPVYGAVMDEWNNVELDIPIEIAEGMTLWFGYEVTHSAATHPAAGDDGPAVVGKGDMIRIPGNSWASLYNLTGFDFNWSLTGYLLPPEEFSTGNISLQSYVNSSVPANPGQIGFTEIKYGPGVHSCQGKSPAGYHIFKSEVFLGDYDLVASLGPDVLEYVDYDIIEGLTYWYYIIAEYSTGFAVSDTIEVPWPGGMADTRETGTSIRPVPATDRLYIHHPLPVCNIGLFTPDGRLVYEKNGVNSRDEQLDVSSLPPGMYYLKLETKQGWSTHKVVVR